MFLLENPGQIFQERRCFPESFSRKEFGTATTLLSCLRKVALLPGLLPIGPILGVEVRLAPRIGLCMASVVSAAQSARCSEIGLLLRELSFQNWGASECPRLLMTTFAMVKTSLCGMVEAGHS